MENSITNNTQELEKATLKLQGFINQPDEAIISSGYENAVTSHLDSILLDSDNEESVQVYEELKKTYTIEEKRSIEAEFVEGQQDLEHWQTVAHAFGIDIGNNTNDIDLTILDAIEDGAQLPSHILLKNIHLLPSQMQSQLRAFLQSRELKNSQTKIIALGSVKQLHNPTQRELTSPLWNTFKNQTERAQAVVFDASRGRSVISQYRNAINNLTTSNEATVSLPSGAGKTQFARLLEQSGNAQYITLERVRKGEGFDLTKLPTLNNALPVLIDEPQALDESQKEQIIKKYGKVIFIETNDLPALKRDNQVH
jgi:hypothetical protein